MSITCTPSGSWWKKEEGGSGAPPAGGAPSRASRLDLGGVGAEHELVDGHVVHVVQDLVCGHLVGGLLGRRALLELLCFRLSRRCAQRAGRDVDAELLGRAQEFVVLLADLDLA